MHIDTETHRHLTRQLDLIPVDTLTKPVTIIGCGAIGSFLALSLAKMGMTDLFLMDPDVVSIENMSNQFFPKSLIDVNKAKALSTLIYNFTDETVKWTPIAYTPDQSNLLAGIVVVAVDSMEARRMVYDSIKEKNFQVDYIIDPRIS